MIKDSGERTEFGTGAVRDMHSGKGRMDLLPWEALVEVSKHCEEGALKMCIRDRPTVGAPQGTGRGTPTQDGCHPAPPYPEEA